MHGPNGHGGHGGHGGPGGHGGHGGHHMRGGHRPPPPPHRGYHRMHSPGCFTYVLAALTLVVLIVSFIF